ncbi:unnamed protein product [Moneuplotes crassus]|uniref:Uncharacterized protein n=1 Tax=Euplotes crassus TaxID=5936 RepID=A0AAD2D5W2_EUPCR|nr:unnamed protein product [Moneuplotes crassus]
MSVRASQVDLEGVEHDREDLRQETGDRVREGGDGGEGVERKQRLVYMGVKNKQIPVERISEYWFRGYDDEVNEIFKRETEENMKAIESQIYKNMKIYCYHCKEDTRTRKFFIKWGTYSELLSIIDLIIRICLPAIILYALLGLIYYGITYPKWSRMLSHALLLVLSLGIAIWFIVIFRKVKHHYCRSCRARLISKYSNVIVCHMFDGIEGYYRMNHANL